MSDVMKVKVLVPCALVLVNLIYGAWQLVAKAAMSTGTSPFVFVFYRALGGTLVMLTALLLVPNLRSRSSTSSNPLVDILHTLTSDGTRCIALGVLMTVNVGGGILAISQLPAITCALFQPTVPIIAATLSMCLGLEKLTMPKIGSIIISVLGAMIVIVYGNAASADGSNHSAMGLLFLCCNVGGGASYIVFLKASGVVEEYSPTFVACISFLVASVFLFVAALVTNRLDGVAWRLGDHNMSLLALCYAVVLTTAFNYSAIAWASKETTPSVVTSFVTLQPIFTVLLSCVFLGILLTPGQFSGGVAIVAGLFFNVHSEPIDSNDMASKSIHSQKEPLEYGEKGC